MVVVVIENPAVEEREAGGYKFRTQHAFLLSTDEKRKFEVSLPRGHAGYQPGRYTFGDACFDLDQYKRPTFSRNGLELVPLKSGS